ncbi:MAG: helix-turn-helix domain-containing protein [Chitinophagaceae bacterium]
MLYIIGIVFTFFLVFLLAGKQNKSTADKILTAWLFVIGLHLILFYLSIKKINFEYPFLLGLEIPIPLLHGPFLYLYTTSLTNQGRTKKAGLLHFIPFFIAIFSLAPFFLLSAQEKINIYLLNGKGFELLMSILLAAIIFSGSSYTFFSLKKLQQHRKVINSYFSYTDKINLRWLLYLIIGLSAIWVLVIIGEEEYIFSAVVLYVLFIGYFGIKQVGIFTNRLTGEIASENFPGLRREELTINKPESKHEENTVDENTSLAAEKLNGEEEQTNTLEEHPPAPLPEKIKYEKSALSLLEKEAIHLRLTEMMNKEKWFKDAEITLGDLAKKLGIHPNTLSQVINSIEKRNFYDYINIQRVDEFKTICHLPANKNYTILSLAFECGFNSKTAFNRNFKKVTNLSPTEYLKSTKIVLQ